MLRSSSGWRRGALRRTRIAGVTLVVSCAVALGASALPTTAAIVVSPTVRHHGQAPHTSALSADEGTNRGGLSRDGWYPEASLLTPANICLLYTSPSPRDGLLSRMPSSA